MSCLGINYIDICSKMSKYLRSFDCNLENVLKYRLYLFLRANINTYSATLKSLSSALLISRYILGLGQHAGAAVSVLLALIARCILKLEVQMKGPLEGIRDLL